MKTAQDIVAALMYNGGLLNAVIVLIELRRNGLKASRLQHSKQYCRLGRVAEVEYEAVKDGVVNGKVYEYSGSSGVGARFELLRSSVSKGNDSASMQSGGNIGGDGNCNTRTTPVEGRPGKPLTRKQKIAEEKRMLKEKKDVSDFITSLVDDVVVDAVIQAIDREVRHEGTGIVSGHFTDYNILSESLPRRNKRRIEHTKDARRAIEEPTAEQHSLRELPDSQCAKCRIEVPGEGVVFRCWKCGKK